MSNDLLAKAKQAIDGGRPDYATAYSLMALVLMLSEEPPLHPEPLG